MRRRRQYDATGASPARVAGRDRARSCASDDVDIAAAGRARCRSSTCSPRTRPRRRGARCSTTSGTSRALLDRLDDPRTGRSRRRALLDELREVLTVWWQTDEVRRVRPRVEDEVRRNLFFFEAVLFDAVPAVLERDRARARRPARAAGARRTARWTGGDMDGHPEVGADTLARALRAAPQHRAAAAARARRPARAQRSRTPRCAIPVVRRSSRRRWSATRAELPSAPTCCAARTASGSRCGPSSASSATGSTTRCARAGASRATPTPQAAAARPRARARPPRLRATSRCGAIRRLLWQVDVFGFHLAGIDIRQGAGVVREATAALLPGYARRRRAAPPGAADRGADLRPARDRARPRRRGGRAAARARHRRAVARDAYGPQAVPAIVISMTEQPSDVLGARPGSPQRAGATLAADGAAVRDARRPRARRRRRWPRSTPASPTARTCARRATARP